VSSRMTMRSGGPVEVRANVAYRVSLRRHFEIASMGATLHGRPEKSSKEHAKTCQGGPMERMRAKKVRVERHAARLAKNAIRYSGRTLRLTGDALGLTESTVGHYVTDRPNRAVLDICTRLIVGSATDPVALMQAQDDAYELGAIVNADTDRLIRDGLALMSRESEVDGAEDDAALRGPLAHADALDGYRRVARRLSLTIRELAERGVDLHAMYRRRVA